ncbi:MotA/TolQ/ExbB proton channel family protein [uncultured Microbulbifer sp.]|uniref:MotA/TolQ/ExbB proton channel family protein n=1 Tax=uncultured Microbulbifer sp. TaxID=348147 RepID=UPI002615DAD3|nr:MotA/TolQ/ExbB proton channel family protein [uncultured Microbulbifer sp.]
MMDFFNSVIAFFQTGGIFMYPILVVFALGTAVAIERYVRLVYERSTNRATWEKVQPVLNTGDFDRARNLVKDDNTGVGRLLAMGLERQGAVRRREDIEIAMEESIMESIPQLEKRTPYVALGSNIATLLGLLGTIMGLIEAFTAVANANPAEKADLLSASISVAMNTTAFGLMVGIALLIVHALLNSLTGQIVDSLEMVSVKALNIMSSGTRRRSDAAKEGVKDEKAADAKTAKPVSHDVQQTQQAQQKASATTEETSKPESA